MRHYKKFLAFSFLLGLLLYSSTSVQAQRYTIAAGWRSGMETNGISVKLVPVQGIGIEGIYNFFPLGHSVPGKEQSTSSVYGRERLQMYALPIVLPGRRVLRSFPRHLRSHRAPRNTRLGHRWAIGTRIETSGLAHNGVWRDQTLCRMDRLSLKIYRT